MKFRAKFCLILRAGVEIYGANLYFVLNPRLKVRPGFRRKICFRAHSFGLWARNFTALWMKFIKQQRFTLCAAFASKEF